MTEQSAEQRRPASHAAGSGGGQGLFRLIFSDRQFISVMVIYGIGVSLLTLAVPISVQVLIEAVANTAVVRAVVVLAVILFVLLAISGLLTAMQIYVLELFERRFFSRMSTEIALRTIYADTAQLERINREGLINHYFEVDMIQKALPSMLSAGLALILQTLVGYIVVSFYHPVFLLFSLSHALLVYLIWRLADRGAVRTVIELSQAKYDMANWLESLARNHRLFKSRRGSEYALKRTDGLTAGYVQAHEEHFRFSFAQNLGFLALYAVGSAVVLGVAGWLVIIGQLSLGQLVAAELILGAIFVGLSRMGYYLELYYAIRAAMDKLSWFFDLPLEQVPGDESIEQFEANVVFDDAVADFRGRRYRIDAEFPAGSQTLVAPENAGIVMVLRDLLEAHRAPAHGSVSLGGHELQDFDAHLLRDHIGIVSDTQMFQSTIADFLHLGRPDLSRAEMRELLEVVGLDAVVEELADGLDTEFNDQGLPLSSSEIIRLKVARALAARPRVLVFTIACDVLRPNRRRRILRHVREALPGTAFIVVSNRRDIDDYDRFMFLGNGHTRVFEHLEALIVHENEWCGEEHPAPSVERPEVEQQ